MVVFSTNVISLDRIALCYIELKKNINSFDKFNYEYNKNITIFIVYQQIND